MKRTDSIIICSLFCLAGIYIGRYMDIAPVLALVGLFFVVVSTRRSLSIVFGLALLSCALGNLRGSGQNAGFEILRGYFETKQTVVGRSLDDAEYDRRGQLAFTMNAIDIDGHKIPGQMAVSGYGEVSVLRGDLVEVTGKVFPARGSNQARVSFAQMDVIEYDNKWYNSLRRKLNKQLRDNLPEPLSSFAGGLLIGQKSTIPDSIITNLRITGLSHIIAVSGYNLTIMVRFVMRVLRRLSRYQKLIISISVITTFLFITGFSASIVRAAIVCGLSLFAWYYGRTFRPAVLLSICAVITTLFRPEYIWGDAGWYLSFLAFTGILLVSPIVKHRLYGDKKPKLLGSILIETISVLIMVTPYSLYLFGTLSLVAVLANVLVVPLIPIAMALSAVVIIVPTWLAVLTVPANAVLSTILELARVIASIPRASAEVEITFYEMVMMYLCVSAVMYMMWNKSRQRLEGNVLVQ